MRRSTARSIHAVTNLAYWIENPEWWTGNAAADTALRVVRALPFGMHKMLKQAFYDIDKVLAVNGETVVAANGPDKVDKFMFRYPGKIALMTFEAHAKDEIGALTSSLDIALPTQVGIKPAYVFRNPATYIDTVTQTQRRLNLSLEGVFDLNDLKREDRSPKLERTARDMENLVTGAEHLVRQHSFYPDIADSSGNLRRNIFDGSLTLIDVMPFYADGSRLIGDAPPNIIPHIQNNLQNYQEFIGQYGS